VYRLRTLSGRRQDRLLVVDVVCSGVVGWVVVVVLMVIVGHVGCLSLLLTKSLMMMMMLCFLILGFEIACH